MDPLKYKTNPRPGRCCVLRCSNKAAGTLCNTHRSQKSRQADPVRYAFNNLRNRAKQRGVAFTIELEQFREWCHKVRLLGARGKTADSYTIDRIHNDVGYHIDNIQVLTMRDNITKYLTYDFRSKMGRYIEVPEMAPADDENPF